MFFILSKILTFLINPFSWIMLLLLMAFFSKQPKRKKRLFTGALIFSFLFSNSFIYNEFALIWEHQIPSQIEKYNHYEAAIIMGGIVGTDEDNKQITFNENAERILNILPYYFEGKVDKILIAGGSGKLLQGEKEAFVLEKYLLSLQVDPADIILDTNSRNTHENALYTAKIINNGKLNGPFLLSTSAVHMPRSLACFQKQNIKVVPYPVDYSGRRTDMFTPENILVPNPKAIINWYWLIHEWVGLLSYKAMGYC